MAELAITKAPSHPTLSRWFRPMVPFGNRLFGMSPTSMMREIARDMDKLFERFDELTEETAWGPAIEYQRTDSELVVTADVPGMKKEDIKVELTDDALILEGERKHEEKAKEKGVVRSERYYGKFYREIPLPEGAKAEEAKAQLANGVLEVRIPVPEDKRKMREIAVEEAKTK